MQDSTVSSLASDIWNKLNSLKGLEKHILEIEGYLQSVIDGRIELSDVNQQIIYNLQDIFNLSPNLRLEPFVKALARKSNDMNMNVYVASLIRSIIALHDLINNKLENKSRVKNDQNKNSNTASTEETAKDKRDAKEEKTASKK